MSLSKNLLSPKNGVQIRFGHKTTIGHSSSEKYLHVLGIGKNICPLEVAPMWVCGCRKRPAAACLVTELACKFTELLLIFHPKRAKYYKDGLCPRVLFCAVCINFERSKLQEFTLLVKDSCQLCIFHVEHSELLTTYKGHATCPSIVHRFQTLSVD
jgi:hypothetical protein